nr:hypothetical protein [Tanacetum cinerariifolium]
TAGHHHAAVGKVFRRDFPVNPKILPVTRSIRSIISLATTRRHPHHRCHHHVTAVTLTAATLSPPQPTPLTPPAAVAAAAAATAAATPQPPLQHHLFSCVPVNSHQLPLPPHQGSRCHPSTPLPPLQPPPPRHHRGC